MYHVLYTLFLNNNNNNLFLSSGVKKGDRVAIYMPMIVELVVAMLACARIGAIHSIVVSIVSCLVPSHFFVCVQGTAPK